jgi:DNA-binding MarR family transcriptional regulator
MNKKQFFINAQRAKLIHTFFLKEKMSLSHMLLLSEISVRKFNKESLPNIKWLQTELQISFTKVKSIVESLEGRNLIIKRNCKKDSRVKLLDLTEEGQEYIYKLFAGLPL